MTKLFILHGWTYQSATWDTLLTLLRARGVDVEFLKIPGLTDGSDPVWTLEDYVQWLREKTGGNNKVILYGHSNGGRISLAFAAEYPEKVARLILEDSAGIPPRGLRKLKRDAFRALSRVTRTILRSEKRRRLFYKVIRENDYGNATPNMKKTLANLVAVDLRSQLARIECPTLIMWGAHDKTTPLKDGVALHQGIRNSKLVVIPDARHSPHITHPEHVAQLIAAELQKT